MFLPPLSIRARAGRLTQARVAIHHLCQARSLQMFPTVAPIRAKELGPFRRRRCLRSFLSLALLLPAALLAGEPWKEKPAQWSLADVTEILTDSPWSPAKDRIEITLLYRRINPLTKLSTDLPTAPREGGLVARAEARQGTPLPPVSVLWWSSKTVRWAQLRRNQLKGAAPKDAALRADKLEQIVIAVEGSEPQRILRDAMENIRETCYLELLRGMALDATGVHFVDSGRAGEDFTAFHFPRKLNGEPAVDPNAGQVTFRCKATAKTERPGRPNALSIRAAFEPRKMRFNGQPDL